MIEFLAMITGMLGIFAVALLLTCWDPVWDRRTSLRDGVSAVMDKD